MRLIPAPIRSFSVRAVGRFSHDGYSNERGCDVNELANFITNVATEKVDGHILLGEKESVATAIG
jgi:hypothetical protein